MSGHSKWATIKRKKAATDAARGKQFSRVIKEISIAVRQGGGPDPDANPRLRTALLSAKSINMPASNIERAIKRASGEGEGVHIEETQYEGYGPGGVAILVTVATDNKNRTVGEIRNIFTKHGGSMSEAGSVAYLFTPRGHLQVEKSAIAEDDLLEIVLEAGADDVQTEGETYDVLTAPEQFEAVKAALEAKGVPVQNAELTRIASTQVPIDDDKAGSLLRLLDVLEDHDDVQRVYSNFSVSDEVMARLAR
jgi:YebC/PmpR family DNA-binding regulatory protein